MARRRSLQTEVLASLALVMGAAVIALGMLALATIEAQIGTLQRLAARTLFEEAQGGSPAAFADESVVWWRVKGEGVHAVGTHAEPLDARSRRLADRAHVDSRALLDIGAPWQPLRFAAPVAMKDVVLVARLSPPASGAWLAAMALAGFLVFTGFGAVLLRRRLVAPLRQLELTAAAFGEGELDLRATCEGPRELASLGQAWNGMAETLAARTGALEKAVTDLRASNHELRETREGLDRAERLAAVGRLAAGVAHEVGNPMGAVLAFVDLARRDEGLSDDGRRHLDRALEEGQRMRKVLRQLLEFSRPTPAERAPIDLVTLVRETSALVCSQRRYSGVEVVVEGEHQAPAALADPQQTRQIVLNLLLNAADAGARRIEVRVAACVGAVRAGEAPGMAVARVNADAVEVRVHDDGPGVAPENRAQLFDPFFSTKEAGEGTGLGLSNALRFAEEAGGGLELLESEAGACFRLWLPAARVENSSRVR